jgi:hypothetical protein
MALEFYVEQADRSPQSGVANETIKAGELVHDDGDGVNVLTYAATDEDAGGHLGLARYDAEAMAPRTDEDVGDENYDSGQRVQYQPQEDSAVVRVRTPEDNGTDPAAAIDHKTVVGVIDAAGGTVASAAEFQGRVVEEGYTDGAGTPTTYDRSSGNFKALGVAYRPDKMHAATGDSNNTFDYPVRVVLFGDLKESA